MSTQEDNYQSKVLLWLLASWETAINVLVWRTPLNTVSDEKHKKSKFLICIFYNKSKCLLMFINILIQITSFYI